MFLSTCNWFQALDQKLFFENKDDHAGEMETSLMMHLTPTLVLPLTEAGDGASKKFKITALREGWAWAERKWTQVTNDTGVGDPRKATAVKGQAFFKAITEKVAAFFTEVADADIRDLYS
jgi:creatinine amidohydrolase